jgi:DNA repair exonuclease SbcCD ATPase subunit
MINFRSITWRNFLSTGNDSTTIQLDRSPTTLIVGHNGSGKSTLLDALSFALFGKPHRNINKPQLINTINNKNCEVEVSFDIGVHKFVIKRGLKPNKFEIWQNGNMINQSSDAKDYQKYLEQNVLKLNHKSFHQIVVLGSSSFIPFMQLPAQHRRDVIEDLLDIQIFSKMSQLLKEKDSKLKEKINDITYQLDLTKEKIVLQQKYIRDINELNDEQTKIKTQEIDTINTEISQLENSNNSAQEYISNNLVSLNSTLKTNTSKKNELIKIEAQLQQQIKTIVSDAKFYEENSTCPTCTQEIPHDIRDTKLDHSKSKAKELHSALELLATKSEKLEALVAYTNSELAHLQLLSNSITTNNTIIAQSRKRINILLQEIAALSNTREDLSNVNSEYASLLDSKTLLSESKNTLSSERLYMSVAAEMLKDTGIKTKVVKQYLPVMNTLINKYLQVLDFFVSFNLDESFNETIRSRYRDSFVYDSFSEGEKQRIDLALLFTWRQIAKMKNSTSTNLLVLDETFDSSLDHDGVENLMKILNTLDASTNVFVISHKGDLLDGKFRNKIMFKKDHNFSKMVLIGD